MRRGTVNGEFPPVGGGGRPVCGRWPSSCAAGVRAASVALARPLAGELAEVLAQPRIRCARSSNGKWRPEARPRCIRDTHVEILVEKPSALGRALGARLFLR